VSGAVFEDDRVVLYLSGQEEVSFWYVLVWSSVCNHEFGVWFRVACLKFDAEAA
jgi:hypothetical protein